MNKAGWGTLCLAWLWLAGCTLSEQQESALACSYTYQCPAGYVCESGGCQLATWEAMDGGAIDGGEADASSPDADTSNQEDAAAPAPVRVPFAPSAYRLCRDDLECAVFGGNCLTELFLSRPDADGNDRVALSDIQPGIDEGQGICTLPCTTDPRVCDTLVVERPGGASTPFACQLVYAAESPYPATPGPFPFAGALDPIALERGVPFASICRPPFQYADAHSPKFCEACMKDADCGAGNHCLMERAHATPASGSCIQGCQEQSECPVGFVCESLVPNAAPEAPKHCVPLEETCGRCLDRDGDQRGVGRCGSLAEPFPDIDCDDTNLEVYHDSRNPSHAFPQHCGEHDFNCNGLSDRSEQLGSAQHCSSCNDVCLGSAGEIANSHRSCQEQAASTFTCVTVCDEGFGDCDGRPETGCEVRLTDGHRWASDRDGDGRGSRTESKYFCDGAVPAGWVKNRFDCDDTQAAVYGGGSLEDGSVLDAAPELCDGLDNNCNGVVDDPGSAVGEGEVCSSGLFGVCEAGRTFCASMDASPPVLTCVPNLTLETQASALELCDGLDNNCNGVIDEGADFFADRGEQNPNGPGAPASCDIPGGVGACARGVWTCGASGWSCVGAAAGAVDLLDPDGIDENCDGTDGDLAGAVFVREAGDGTLDGNDNNDGSAQRPVATFKRAMALACANAGECRDIYVQDAVFTTQQALRIPTFALTTQRPPVRIYGGFNATADCTANSCELRWVRGTRRTRIVRVAPQAVFGSKPYGSSYAAIEAESAGVLSFALDQVDLHVRAPSGMLEEGADAPAQIAIQCPEDGCGQLGFRNSSIEVDSAMDGGLGSAAEAPAFGLVDGRDGCTANTNCTPTNYAFVDNEWMEFAGTSAVGGENSFGGRGAQCARGSAANGGNSAGYRVRPEGGGDRAYYFETSFSGGCRAWDNDGNTVCSSQRVASRGSDGRGGSGGYYTGSGTLRLTPERGVAWDVARAFTYASPTHGYNGGSGGGGGGCVARSGYFDCRGPSVRGGGGGAGGCSGVAGGNGGNGGQALGILLVPPAAGELTLGDAYDLSLPLEGFAVRVGDGGKGGDGSPGSAAAPGGYGGRVATNGAYVPEYQGANGGDGGGGGGGTGGYGGTSLGVVRYCNRAGGNLSNGCFMRLPPRMLAEPAAYIQVGKGGAGGKAAPGGAGGQKPLNVNLTDSPVGSDTLGHSGVDGAEAFSHTLLYLGN